MKVSLLFLTYGKPFHTIEWIGYMYNPEKFNIIVHPKYPEQIKNTVWQTYVSSKIIDTKWGTDTIVMATLILLKQALDLNNSDWFVLCSGDSYPLFRESNDCFNYFNGKTRSIFHPIDENNPSKVSQWFAMYKTDAMNIINNLRIDENYNIQNKQLYNSIISKIPKNAAVDELFFIPLLKKINENYQYDTGIIHYVKWIPHWISKHPTIFNRLLPSDEISIKNNNALFIRKTFPTFKNETILPKKNAVIITIGTDNIDKINYDDFLKFIKDTHDLYLLIMIDSIDKISDNLKSQCVQAYSVVWNNIEIAHEKIISIDDGTTRYDEVIILKENDNPYDHISPQLLIKSENSTLPKFTSDIFPTKKFRPVTPDFPPPNFNLNLKSQPQTQSPEFAPDDDETIKSIEYNPNYKVAYLFLLRGDINQPKIWTTYFDSATQQHISKYVHSKEQDSIRTPWIRDALIEDIRPTGWGYIVDAYFSLFREAIKDPNNLKFVLISESCVPVKNYYEFKNYLNNTDYRNSYVHFLKPSPWDIKQRIENQPNYQQFGKFTKHYARMCLSRYHVEKLLSQSKSRIDFFVNMHVGDEFFLTLINAKPDVDFILNKTITYDNWEDVQKEVNELKKKIYKLKDERKSSNNEKILELETKMNDIRKNPKTYHEITPEDINTVLSSGAFFWRKIPANLLLTDYYNIYGTLIKPIKRGVSRIKQITRKKEPIRKKGGTRKYKSKKYKTRKYKLKKYNSKKLKNKK